MGRTALAILAFFCAASCRLHDEPILAQAAPDADADADADTDADADADVDAGPDGGRDGGADAGEDAGAPAWTCIEDDAACETASECCSLGCHDGACGEPMCGGRRAACDLDQDCCTDACNAGDCGDIGSCGVAGESCTFDTDCCSWSCGDGRCEPLEECRVVGELCPRGNEECCSLSCSPGDPPRCQNIGSCAVTGELCVLPTDCCTRDCTDLRCIALDTCQVIGELCPNGDADCCSSHCSAGDPPRCRSVRRDETEVSDAEAPRRGCLGCALGLGGVRRSGIRHEARGERCGPGCGRDLAAGGSPCSRRVGRHACVGQVDNPARQRYERRVFAGLTQW